MSERYLVLEPNADLLNEAVDAQMLDRPLFLKLVRLAKYTIDLTENQDGELRAAEQIDMDFGKLEITRGKFVIDKINQSRTIIKTDDGTVPKITPEHTIKGVCAVGMEPFPKPAILSIPGDEKYAANIEVFDPNKEYLYDDEA
jgi:hypothetical protein